MSECICKPPYENQCKSCEQDLFEFNAESAIRKINNIEVLEELINFIGFRIDSIKEVENGE